MRPMRAGLRDARVTPLLAGRGWGVDSGVVGQEPCPGACAGAAVKAVPRGAGAERSEAP